MSSPTCKTAREKEWALCVSIAVNENPFETVNWWENDRWCPPPMHETTREKSKLFAYLYRQWEPIQNSQLIGIYKKYQCNGRSNRYIETNTQLDTIGRWTPHHNCQSAERTLHCSMSSMRATGRWASPPLLTHEVTNTEFQMKYPDR